MISYPNLGRAERTVRRRREQYLRTLYANVPRRLVLGLSDELGYDVSQFTATSGTELRPVLDHIDALHRRYDASFRQLFLDTRITSLDTSSISTA